jgi:hypothetical protein
VSDPKPAEKCSATTPRIPAIRTEILSVSLDGQECTQGIIRGNKDRVSNGDDGMLRRDDSRLGIDNFCDASRRCLPCGQQASLPSRSVNPSYSQRTVYLIPFDLSWKAPLLSGRGYYLGVESVFQFNETRLSSRTGIFAAHNTHYALLFLAERQPTFPRIL